MKTLVFIEDIRSAPGEVRVMQSNNILFFLMLVGKRAVTRSYVPR